MTDAPVTRFPGVYRRSDSAVLWFVLRVPQDLLHLYSGPWAVRKSLGTRDVREANEQAKALHDEWARIFAAQRAAASARDVDMSPELAASLAADVYRWILEADDNLRRFPEGSRGLLAAKRRGSQRPQLLLPVRTEPQDPLAGLSDEQRGAVAEFNAGGAAAAAIALAGANLRAALPYAEAVAASRGLRVDWTSEAGRSALLQCLRALRQATQAAAQRDAGDVVDTPEPAAAASAQPSSVKRHSVHDAYLAWVSSKPGRPLKTLATYEAAATRLEAIIEGRPLESLTREDGRNITAALLAEAMRKGGTAQNTAGTLLSRFKTLLEQAVDLEWIEKNPLDGRSIERVKVKRAPWKPADLVKLFDHPLFTRYEVPSASAAGKDAAYWLPLLGLYTGARISELAQLRTEDIWDEPGAGWVLQIKEDSEGGQRVKNIHSIRVVPIHGELVRLGLIDYWRAIAKAAPGPLWPAIVRSERNGAGGKVSQWFGDFKTSQGFGPELVFHSFRHTLETELRALSVPKYHIDALAGHSGETVSDDYAHPTPAVLRGVNRPGFNRHLRASN